MRVRVRKRRIEFDIRMAWSVSDGDGGRADLVLEICERNRRENSHGDWEGQVIRKINNWLPLW